MVAAVTTTAVNSCGNDDVGCCGNDDGGCCGNDDGGCRGSDDGGCRGTDDGGCCGNDDGGYRGNDDDATATATTISAYITNTNKFVKTVVSVADGDSGISGGDGMQGKGPVALMYKKKQTSGVSL